MQKRYWLRGLLIGFMAPTFLSVGWLGLSSIGFSLQDAGMAYIFIVFPAIIVGTLAGWLIGYAYGKSKTEKVLPDQFRQTSRVWKKLFNVLVTLTVAGLILLALRLVVPWFISIIE